VTVFDILSALMLTTCGTKRACHYTSQTDPLDVSLLLSQLWCFHFCFMKSATLCVTLPECEKKCLATEG